jgi:IS30 family transposase
MAGEKRKELSLEQRWEIINCHKLKKYIRKISEITGFQKSTVSDTINRFKKTNSAKNYHEVVVSLCYLHQIIVIYGCAHYVIVAIL